jgi:hypothetical protein
MWCVGMDAIALLKRLFTVATDMAIVANKAQAERDAARREQADCAAKQQRTLEDTAAQSLTLRDKTVELERLKKEVESVCVRQCRDQENTRKELEAVKKHRQQMLDVFKQIRDLLVCPICTEVAILPKVLGTCGHIACQNCLKSVRRAQAPLSHHMPSPA